MCKEEVVRSHDSDNILKNMSFIEIILKTSLYRRVCSSKSSES